uniref:Uncharacterized protein n=1 Tax=Prymnesium polylepis TaxID=72548 RepID=A0A7S4HG96_9EUKA
MVILTGNIHGVIHLTLGNYHPWGGAPHWIPIPCVWMLEHESIIEAPELFVAALIGFRCWCPPFHWSFSKISQSDPLVNEFNKAADAETGSWKKVQAAFDFITLNKDDISMSDELIRKVFYKEVTMEEALEQHNHERLVAKVSQKAEIPPWLQDPSNSMENGSAASLTSSTALVTPVKPAPAHMSVALPSTNGSQPPWLMKSPTPSKSSNGLVKYATMDMGLFDALHATGLERCAPRLTAMDVNTVNAFLSLGGSFGEGSIDESEIQTIHAELQGSPPSEDNWPAGPTGVRAIRRIILELRDARREAMAMTSRTSSSGPSVPGFGDKSIVTLDV